MNDRHPLKVEAVDAFGRKSWVGAGVENGQAIFRTPPGSEGFALNRSQCRDMLRMVETVCTALDMQAGQ